MSKAKINVHLIGRFGNQCFTYAFARAYALRVGATLHCNPWSGSKLFGIDDPPLDDTFPFRDENTLGDGETNVTIRSYCQNQKSLIYTRAQVRRWFTLTPRFQTWVDDVCSGFSPVVGHRRVQDYKGYGYPIVSEASYRKAARDAGAITPIEIVSDEHPRNHFLFRQDEGLDWVPDFYRLANATLLFRGNSSFSWWASVLGNGITFSPVIDGLVGGIEHECEFVRGNHPKFCNLDGITELNLKEA